MDHSNLYEEESDPDDYDKLEAEFGARNLLGALKDALESEERNGEDEDAGVGKFGEASLATNAESNKAGSGAPEIGIAGAGLGSERWKEGSSKKEGKNTRKHKKKKKAEKEVAFNMAAIMAATTVSKGEDPMHLQDPLRGDYLEQTGKRDSFTPLWRCIVPCATSSCNMALSEDLELLTSFPL